MARAFLTFLLLVGILAAPEDLSSCGPFLPATVFSNVRAPLNEAAYYAGRLEVLQPTYNRIYLMAAYRYLTGAGLSSEDQRALMAASTSQAFTNGSDVPALQEWLKTREKAGAPPLDRIEQFRPIENNEYVLNCGDDSFRNATLTFERRAQEGRPKDELRVWVDAQDQVFASCALPATPPEPAPLDAAPWIRADRAYQIAAARFYAGNFDAAAADFEAIATDRSSPWHAIAPYLGARALIRKTTLQDARAAPAAVDQLQKVVMNPECKPWHDSARGLMRYVAIETDPVGAATQLAHDVESTKAGVAGEMNDLRLLLNRLDLHQRSVPREADLIDWIGSFTSDTKGYAEEKWDTTHSLTWMVAALTWSGKPDAELMAAAKKVPEESPAYLTVQFHLLRLSPPDDARAGIERMLRRNDPATVRNLFLAEQMRLARNWNELLHYAPRTAVGQQYEGQPAELLRGKPLRYFDDDAARILNRQAPLQILRTAAESPLLPANLRFQAARAVWVQAAVTGDTTLAKAVAPVTSTLVPILKPYLDEYLAAPDVKTRNFAAAWLLLHNPGMRPYIDSGAGRITPLASLDNLRDNWWQSAPQVIDPEVNRPLELLYQGTGMTADFVTEGDRRRAEAEHDKLARAPAATTFMARQAVEWADVHPEDPRSPEALRLAIRAVHYSFSGDADTNRWAKQAFEMLHARFPTSEAARRTRYWYRTGVQ